MHAQRFYGVPTPSAEYLNQSASGQAPGNGALRTRLAELDSYIHCSVIGTCLTRVDLRDIVARFAGLDRDRASDFEMHHAAVQIAAEGGQGAEVLHEVLDHRYDGEIKRFDQASSENELCQLWRAGRRNGDTAGAYWALMTHPHATRELRQRILGELHGLTYLVTNPSPAPDAD
ncbi:hypothetical protein [Paraburkholderia caffeinilytica]|uniref:hypothetical protein n=1 Tax=Paraburkholderia caffeinilytica TaxID=1761016 RepID=UPI0038B8E8A6